MAHFPHLLSKLWSHFVNRPVMPDFCPYTDHKSFSLFSFVLAVLPARFILSPESTDEAGGAAHRHTGL